MKTMQGHDDLRYVATSKIAPSTNVQIHAQTKPSAHPPQHNKTNTVNIKYNVNNHHQLNDRGNVTNYTQPIKSVSHQTTDTSSSNHDYKQSTVGNYQHISRKVEPPRTSNNSQQNSYTTNNSFHYSSNIDQRKVDSDNPDYQEINDDLATTDLQLNNGRTNTNNALRVNGTIDVVDTPINNISLSSLPKDQLLLQTKETERDSSTKERKSNKR